MVTVVSLWLPVLLSARRRVFASWIIHTVLKYHNNDQRCPTDAVMDALRKFNIPVGEYMIPRCDNMEADEGARRFSTR